MPSDASDPTAPAAAVSPQAREALSTAFGAINELAPLDAVDVMEQLIAQYASTLAPARTLAFTRAVAKRVSTWGDNVTDALKKSKNGEEGVYDGWELSYSAGRRKCDYTVLESEFPDAYDAAVSVGDPFSTIKVTAQL